MSLPLYQDLGRLPVSISIRYHRAVAVAVAGVVAVGSGLNGTWKVGLGLGLGLGMARRIGNVKDRKGNQFNIQASIIRWLRNGAWRRKWGEGRCADRDNGRRNVVLRSRQGGWRGVGEVS